MKDDTILVTKSAYQLDSNLKAAAKYSWDYGTYDSDKVGLKTTIICDKKNISATRTAIENNINEIKSLVGDKLGLDDESAKYQRISVRKSKNQDEIDIYHTGFLDINNSESYNDMTVVKKLENKLLQSISEVVPFAEVLDTSSAAVIRHDFDMITSEDAYAKMFKKPIQNTTLSRQSDNTILNDDALVKNSSEKQFGE